MLGRSALITIATALLAAGCALDWDGPRPAPADARVEGLAADAHVDSPAADAAVDQATPDKGADMYVQDLPWSDAPQDAALPDVSYEAAPDLTKPDLPTCPYAYWGHTKPADSVTNLNNKVNLGWKPVGFPHATPAHAAWMVDKTKTYELVEALDGAALESAVDAKLKAGKGYTVEAFLATTGTAVWMEKGGLYKFAKDAATVSSLAKKSWKVHAYLRHAGLDYATWMQKGADYKLMQNKNQLLLAQDVRDEIKYYGWLPTQSHVNSGEYGLSAFDNVVYYELRVSPSVSTINIWLTSMPSSWSWDIVAVLPPHAAWVSQGHQLIIAQAGDKLAGQLNLRFQQIPKTKLERFFAKQGNVVWLHKACP